MKQLKVKGIIFFLVGNHLLDWTY